MRSLSIPDATNGTPAFLIVAAGEGTLALVSQVLVPSVGAIGRRGTPPVAVEPSVAEVTKVAAEAAQDREMKRSVLKCLISTLFGHNQLVRQVVFEIGNHWE